MANLFVSPYDPKPYLTYLYVVAALIVTVPSIYWPELNSILGGLEQQEYPSLLFTAAFQHGFSGVPALVHLAGNLALLLILGSILERLLGTWRFGLLVLVAIASYTVALYVAPIEANGSSGVIWAFGPPIFVALSEARVTFGISVRNTSMYQILSNVLVLMYIVIIIMMMALPYLGGFRGNLGYAFIFGNLFHFVATAVGMIAAVIFGPRIRRKIHRLSLGPAIAPDELTGADTIAIGIGIALNSMMLTVEVLTVF